MASSVIPMLVILLSIFFVAFSQCTDALYYFVLHLSDYAQPLSLSLSIYLTTLDHFCLFVNKQVCDPVTYDIIWIKYSKIFGSELLIEETLAFSFENP